MDVSTRVSPRRTEQTEVNATFSRETAGIKRDFRETKEGERSDYLQVFSLNHLTVGCDLSVPATCVTSRSMADFDSRHKVVEKRAADWINPLLGSNS